MPFGGPDLPLVVGPGVGGANGGAFDLAPIQPGRNEYMSVSRSIQKVCTVHRTNTKAL